MGNGTYVMTGGKYEGKTIDTVDTGYLVWMANGKKYDDHEQAVIELANRGAVWQPGMFVMPFGKYKGQPMSSIDAGYLQYIVDKFDPGDVRDRCEKELATRNPDDDGRRRLKKPEQPPAMSTDDGDDIPF